MKEEIKQAFAYISNVCAEYKGSKQEHILIEKTLQKIYEELNTKFESKEVELNKIINK